MRHNRDMTERQWERCQQNREGRGGTERQDKEREGER